MKKYFFRIFSIFILFISLSSTDLSAGTIEIPDKIRVVIANDVNELDLSLRGKYLITTIETGEQLKRGQTFFNIKIKPKAHGISFGKDYFKIHGIEIKPDREPSIYLGKRLYRGSLQIIRTEEGLLKAINIIDLEDYLKGVLYHEVSHRWPMEAIKAQAIVSRTFALYQAQQNKNNYYYLTDNVSSQVYGGVYAEKYRTNKAVDATRNMVLMYRDKILPCFFHATCGGRTEDASMLWKVDLKPLKGASCRYCKNSPHFNWQKEIDLAEIEKRLSKAGYNIEDLRSIKVIKRDRSGRVVSLKIKGKNFPIGITAKKFREILGPRLIRSTNFNITIKGDKAYIKGRGWGHGVGMCQWGAFSMAKKRRSVRSILRLYYPGAKIVRLRY